MKDPVARERAEEALDAVEAERSDRVEQVKATDRQVEELRGLVARAALDDDSLTAINPLVHNPTFTNVAPYPMTPRADPAARVAVLTIVLCYENLRDALQFDTWGGLQDAKTLDERAAVLRGWLGTIAVVEMAAATACYDELAGT